MEETKSINVYNLLIVDESGSMHSIYEQALSGINETINGIRNAQTDYPDQNQYVSIVTFEGNGMNAVKFRRDRVPVSKVEDMTSKDYRPGGCTPLYDAMGKTISHLDACINEGDAVLVTIITDGYENSSEEFSGRAVKELVSRQREKGWTFAYIGANQDSVEVARDLNISNAMNFDASPSGTVHMSVKYEKARKKFLKDVDFCIKERIVDRNSFLGKLEDLFVEDEK